ncbi:oligosaccharide flippase family protein [Demequina zhanjiangensis]|uniref:Oligosaccharide flippase family protein n=1 Tax=Demequina zhanjiangensis TaxID=3051659 RepID=A0ABT8FYN5_9MICO|nr:oligosaccharide flippase family protein [Demequina sp. SYSU T00b26]MDN4472019.1 oligosaccharide flippase family protein [Demequina sp. SYSU T00b26]
MRSDSALGGRRSFGRDALTAAVSGVANPLSMLIVSPVLARVLGVEGRGELAAATAPLSLAIVVLAFGIPETLTHFLARDRRLARGVGLYLTAALVVLGLIGVSSIYLLAPVLSGSVESLERLIRLASIALVPALGQSALRGWAMGHHLWRSVAAERYLTASVRLLGVYGLALGGALTVTTATIVMAAAYAIGGVSYLPAFARSLRTQSAPPAEDGARKYFLYAALLWFGTLSGALLGRIDQVLITPLSATGELGIYVVAVNVAEAILVFNTAFRDVIFPRESAAPSLDRLAQVARTSTLITALVGIGVCVAAPLAVPWIFGDDFSGSTLVIVVLVVGLVVGNPGSIAGAGLAARGRPGIRSGLLFASVVTNVVLLFVLVPNYGALGAAMAASVANAAAGIGAVVAMWIVFDAEPVAFALPRVADLTALPGVFRKALRS